MAQSRLDLEQVRSILSEYRIHNADITLRCDATADDLIDVVEGNRVYIPAIYLLNKIDQISIEVENQLNLTVNAASFYVKHKHVMNWVVRDYLSP